MKQNFGFTKSFWLVVIGQIISLFGNSVVRFALPIHLLNVTGSAATFGFVTGFSFLPMAIMSPLGGIIADRINKRNIMVFLDFFTSGLTVLFLILYGKVNLIGLILVFLFILYGIGGAYQPSVQASIPVLVQPERVMSATVIINMVSSLSGLLGPALGGIAYSLWGIYPVLYAAAICFFLSAVMEIFIQIPFAKREKSMSILRETKDDLLQSITYITKERTELAKVTLCCTGVNLILSSLIMIGLPVVVLQQLAFASGEASRLYGYMQATLAVGGLIGGMTAGILGSKLKLSESWKQLNAAGFLLAPMGIVLMTNCPPYLAYIVLTTAGMAIMAFASIYTIQMISYVQITVPQEIVGKVISWIIAASTCAQPLGQVIYGFLFETAGKASWGLFYGAAVLSMAIALYSKQIIKEL